MHRIVADVSEKWSIEGPSEGQEYEEWASDQVCAPNALEFVLMLTSSILMLVVVVMVGVIPMDPRAYKKESSEWDQSLRKIISSWPNPPAVSH